jgi:Uma2 family endonuclease
VTPSGFKLATNPDTVREPDIAFVSRERLPNEIPRGFWAGPPDLAVEIRSPGDRRSEIWVVDPNQQTVTVHRPAAQSTLFALDDVLDGGDVLPAFTCTVKHLLGFERR